MFFLLLLPYLIAGLPAQILIRQTPWSLQTERAVHRTLKSPVHSSMTFPLPVATLGAYTRTEGGSERLMMIRWDSEPPSSAEVRSQLLRWFHVSPGEKGGCPGVLPSEADAYHEHLRQRLPIATRQRKAGDMLATILTDTSMRAYANGDGGWELESEVPINPAIRCQILLHINGEGR